MCNRRNEIGVAIVDAGGWTALGQAACSCNADFINVVLSVECYMDL